MGSGRTEDYQRSPWCMKKKKGKEKKKELPKTLSQRIIPIRSFINIHDASLFNVDYTRSTKLYSAVRALTVSRLDF